MANERVERRLAAILAADVAGYSRLMGLDEEGTLAQLKACRRELVDPKIAEHRGRIVKTTGDGMLVEFASVVDAVRCAIEVQRGMATRNADVSPDSRIEFRVGINLGDIIIDSDDIYGDGVNIAARLEALAEPGGVCVSGKVHDEVRDKLDLAFEDMGEQQVKNIARPVRVYKVAGTNLGDQASASGPAERTALPLPDKPSLAVLPFQNMSGDPEQEYFTDGLTEDIITELARISSMSVTARNSVFVYKGRAVDVKQVGRDLGVRYVLEGSIRRANQRIRITAQLIETASGTHLWAEKYDRDLADIFDIQDEITRSVVGSTQTQVVLSEGALAERNERPDFRTWDLAKRGWKSVYDLTQESLQKACEIAGELTLMDPSFAKGHQLAAAAAYQTVLMGFSADEQAMLEMGLQAVRKAIRLDDRDEYSHWVLGNILGPTLGQHDKAIAAYERALELNPNFSLAFGGLGTVLAFAGRTDESIRNSEICIRSNPRDPSVFFRFSGLALAHFVAEDYAKAREWAAKTVERKREWWQGHALLACSFAFLGEEDEARMAVRYWLEVFPGARIGQLPPIPFKNPAHAERFRDGLRRAGLPE